MASVQGVIPTGSPSASIGTKAGFATKSALSYFATVTLFVLAVIALVLLIIKLTGEDENNQATTTFITAAYHQGCRTTGGCCASCPFVSSDDPRVVITEGLKEVRQLRSVLGKQLKHDNDYTTATLEQMSVTAKAEPTPATCDSSSPDTTITIVANGIVGRQSGLYSKIESIIEQLKVLDATFSNRATIDVALINARTRAYILKKAAETYSSHFIIASAQLHSKFMMHKIKTTPADISKKIPNFDNRCMIADEKAGTSGVNATSINGLYCSSIAQSEEILRICSAAVAETTAAETLTSELSSIMNIAATAEQGADSVERQIVDVQALHTICSTSRESFTNDLPGKLSSDKITELIESGDYETAIIRTALEPDLVSNHKKFAKERASFEGGGGVHSVRDDDNDLMPWVGLFGRPTYRKSNGTSVEISNEALKSIPSEYPDQVMRKASLKLSTSKY